MSTVGLLFLTLAAASPDAERPAVELEADAPEPEAPSEVPMPVDPPPTVTPQHDALEHLDRAHALEAAGELDAAEAELSTAISLEPDDAQPYLARAQLRMALAERSTSDDSAAHRARAGLLRLAAQDLGAYIERASLPSDGVAWFRARQEALRRDADALDPPVAEVEPELEPVPEAGPAIPSGPLVDEAPRRRASALVGTGAVAAAAGVGLAAASLRIEQRCSIDGYCGARWQARPSLLAPAAVLTSLGTTAIVLGLARAPALERSGPRRAVMASGLALGATATVLGTITGALAGARWSAPVSPSDDASLGVMQALGNTSAASFAAALPLLSAGITALVRGRLARPSERFALRGRRR